MRGREESLCGITQLMNAQQQLMCVRRRASAFDAETSRDISRPLPLRVSGDSSLPKAEPDHEDPATAIKLPPA